MRASLRPVSHGSLPPPRRLDSELPLTRAGERPPESRSAIVQAERPGRHPFRMMPRATWYTSVAAVIEPLADTPQGVLGFRVAGEIHRDDYDNVLTPALQQALDSGSGLRTLYLIESLDKMDPSALWADAKVGTTWESGTTTHGYGPRSLRTSTGWRARRDCSHG